jgi:hypothetical protein
MATKTLRYPSDLRSSYPTIRFSCRDGKELGAVIDLPIPQGVKFSDGGNYDSTDLGVAAESADVLANAAQNLLSPTGLAKGGVALAATSVANKAISAAGDFGKDVQFYRKQIIPPNTNTTFSGNTMRTFSFDFKMVARTREDTENIRAIHSTFRRYIYAAAAGDMSAKLIISYPPVWTIQFFVDGIESIYYPKIFSCYMKTANSSIGNLSNAVMSNGAPIDVDLSLEFQETRVLNRLDIDNLEGKGDRGIDPVTGLARA